MHTTVTHGSGIILTLPPVVTQLRSNKLQNRPKTWQRDLGSLSRGLTTCVPSKRQHPLHRLSLLIAQMTPDFYPLLAAFRAERQLGGCKHAPRSPSMPCLPLPRRKSRLPIHVQSQAVPGHFCRFQTLRERAPQSSVYYRSASLK